jgi:hypothetical protein
MQSQGQPKLLDCADLSTNVLIEIYLFIQSTVLSKSTRYLFWLGALAGAIYLPIVLQIMLGSGFLRQVSQSVTLYFFPVCWAALGLGFLPGKSSGIVKRAAGLIVLFLCCSLFFPIQVDSETRLLLRIAACWIPAGVLYFLIGREFSARVQGAGHRVHLYYGIFLLGFVAGGVFSDQAVVWLGGNGLLLFLSGVLLLSPLRLAFALPGTLLVVFAASKADVHVERRRNVGHYEATDSARQIREERNYLINHAVAFDKLAWNRRGQTFYYLDEKSNSYLWILNLQMEHRLPLDQKRDSREFIHSRFLPGERVLLIGAGSGRSLASIGAGAEVTAVERDENTVRLLRESGINPFFNKVQFIAADGRAVAERLKNWNWIVLESAVDQRNFSPFQILQAQGLYTPEAVGSYLNHLNDSGTLVVEIHRADYRPRWNAATAVARALESRPDVQKLYVRSVDGPRSLWLLARKGFDPLQNLVAGQRLEIVEPGALAPAACVGHYSDRAPFLDWMCLPNKAKPWLLVLSLGFFALFLFCAAYGRRFLAVAKGREPSGPLVFLFQSVSHCFIFLAVCYQLRGVFGDEIQTFYVFNYTTALIAAAASFVVFALIERNKSIPRIMVVGAMAASALWMLWVLSRPELHSFISLPVFVAGVVPFYFFSALYFHELIKWARERSLGIQEAMLYDSLAFLPAYAVLPWLLFEFGIPALLGGGFACFAISVLLLRARKSAG